MEWYAKNENAAIGSLDHENPKLDSVRVFRVVNVATGEKMSENLSRELAERFAEVYSGLHEESVPSVEVREYAAVLVPADSPPDTVRLFRVVNAETGRTQRECMTRDEAEAYISGYDPRPDAGILPPLAFVQEVVAQVVQVASVGERREAEGDEADEGQEDRTTDYWEPAEPDRAPRYIVVDGDWVMYGTNDLCGSDGDLAENGDDPAKPHVYVRVDVDAYPEGVPENIIETFRVLDDRGRQQFIALERNEAESWADRRNAYVAAAPPHADDDAAVRPVRVQECTAFIVPDDDVNHDVWELGESGELEFWRFQAERHAAEVASKMAEAGFKSGVRGSATNEATSL